MKWEYIGVQSLPDRKGKTSRTLRPEMWRSRVPGGWLVLVANAYDMKSPTFYPDPDHLWKVETEADPASRMLLRPAAQHKQLPEE